MVVSLSSIQWSGCEAFRCRGKAVKHEQYGALSSITRVKVGRGTKKKEKKKRRCHHVTQNPRQLHCRRHTPLEKSVSYLLDVILRGDSTRSGAGRLQHSSFSPNKVIPLPSGQHKTNKGRVSGLSFHKHTELLFPFTTFGGRCARWWLGNKSFLVPSGGNQVLRKKKRAVTDSYRRARVLYVSATGAGSP